MRVTIRCGVLDETFDALPAEGAPLFWPVLKSVENAIPTLSFSPGTVCVFASKQAVKVVQKNRVAFPPDVKFAAVGASTASTLEKWFQTTGFAHSVLFDKSREGLKALLQGLLTTEAQHVILFCAGDGVSQSIALEFSDRIRVTAVACYQTEVLASACPLSAAQIESSDLVVFSCFSGKVLNACYESLLKMFAVANYQGLPPSVVFSFGQNYKTAVDESIRLGLPASRTINSDL